MRVGSDLNKDTKKIELCVSKVHKGVITEASVLAGFGDVSEYIIHVTLADAQRVIRDHKILTLSKQDCNLFSEALQNPPAIDKNLQKAFKEFRECQSD